MVRTGVARPYSACRSGSGLNEGLGIAVGHQRNEVRNAHINSRLEKKCRDLASVMGLVIEEVKQKIAKSLGVLNPRHVVVTETRGKVLWGELRRPLADQFIQSAPIGP